MRNPRQRIGDGLGIFLLWQNLAEETVILRLLQDVERSRWHIMALLVAGRHHAVAWMHAGKRLAESIAEHFVAFAIGRHSEHASIQLADRRSLLAALRDDEGPIRTELH